MKKLFVAFLIPVLVGIVFSASTGKGEKNFNLLFISLDTTRADSIGIYGNTKTKTPNLDNLGQNGIVFKNCYAPVPLTLPSHCSIFTGRYPLAHQVRNNGTYYLGDHELTMAEIFKSHGYLTSAIIASFTLFSKFGLDQGFDLYDESFHSQNMILNFLSEITADKVYDKFAAWLRQHDGNKFFLWVHFYDPHYPYLPHPEVDTKFDHTNWMRYYGEISFADRYVGKIIDDLEAKNLLDDTMVVIVGDHGEAFGEHGEYGHGIFCYEESLKVPLIFYNRRLFKKSSFVDERVSIVDLMPTILDIYGYEIPPFLQGISFARLIEGKKDKHKRLIYFESMDGQEKNNWAPLTGIIENDYKYISLPETELYDLSNDSIENNNLVNKEMRLAKNMDKKLMEFVSTFSGLPEPSKRRLTPDDIKKLKSLGYISSFDSKSNKMIDPKKGVILYAAIEGVKEKIKQGFFDRAEKELSRITAENPGLSLPNIYQASYEIKKNTGRESEAMAILEKGLIDFPDNEEFKIQLALSYFDKRQWEKTEELCSRLLDNNPLFTGAYILLGDINENKNKIEEAIRNYEKALEIEPQNDMAKAKYTYLLVKNDQYDKAITSLSELQKQMEHFINPAQLEIMVDTGILLAEKNELESALAVLQKVVEISPSHPEAWLNLGMVYLKYGQIDKAQEHYQKAIEIDPDFAMAYSNLGMLNFTRYMESNENRLRDNALDNYNKAIRLNPDLADAYNGRGAIYFSLNKINEAILDFKRAIEIKPDYFDAYINISVVFYQIGHKSEAIKYLNSYKKNYHDRLSQEEKEALDRLFSELKK